MTPALEYEQKQRRLLEMIRGGGYHSPECQALLAECAGLWDKMTAEEQDAFQEKFKGEHCCTNERLQVLMEDDE